jgi:hypothetical protein
MLPTNYTIMQPLQHNFLALKSRKWHKQIVAKILV